MAAQLVGARHEGLGDALFAAAVVIHQPLVDDRRIAQPEGVVERLAVPVGGPLAAEIVDQRVVEAGRPAQLARLLGLARLLLELAVHLGQHQEQRVLLLGAVGRVAPIVWSIHAVIMSERSRTSWLPSGMHSRMAESSRSAE